MSKVKFTPGPWSFEDDPGQVCKKCETSNYEAYLVYSKITHVDVAIVMGGGTQKEDARLIAAAPDLYAQLESVIEALSWLTLALRDQATGHPETLALWNTTETIRRIKEGQATLEKARGEL